MDRWKWGKLRFDRAVLRWWLIVVGLLVVDSNWTLFFIGAALAWAGALLHFVSKGYLIQDRVLARTGPYRFTRNPFYLANLISEAGLLVVIGEAWLAMVYIPAWFIIYDRQISAEESVLRRKFGEDFKEYCRSVPRLFPLPWRYIKEAGDSQFSWRNRNITRDRALVRSARLAAYPFILLAADFAHDLGFKAANEFSDPLYWLILAFLLLLVGSSLVSAMFSRLTPQPEAT